MASIEDFEAFLLAEGQANFHVRRKGRATLSLPVSQEGALNAFKLYQPQRLAASLKAKALTSLINLGLHPRVLKEGRAMSERKIQSWDFAYSPETVGILIGSSEHVVERAIASYRGKDGWEVAKLGMGTAARTMLRHESSILSCLVEKNIVAPRCLGLHEQGDFTILRMSQVVGKSMDARGTDRALDLLNQWIGDGAPQAITQFEEWQSIRAALISGPNGKAVLDCLSRNVLTPVIAHGDFARWNLLDQPDGRLMALDWEWGNTRGLPGLDLVHYFIQDAQLVRRLPVSAVIQQVEAQLGEIKAINYLRKTGWNGDLIEPILACVAYKQGAKHQNNPALLAACLSEYELRLVIGRESSPSATPQEPHLKPKPSGTMSTHHSKRQIAFSIVTPSYHQVEILKRCAASVADQSGDFTVEHLIHDGGTGKEFDQWAAFQDKADCVIERDDGMYDAINRGFKRASGDVVAWLNCDEQYLPGTLQQVAQYFLCHPEVDILIGDVILVNSSLRPLAYRRAVPPTIGHIRHSHLSTFSAATFVRRKVLDDGHFLETRWKTIADAVWIDRLLNKGYCVATLGKPLATFAMLGSNLGQSTKLDQERRAWEEEVGATHPLKKRFYIYLYRVQKLFSGAYFPRKVNVEAYGSDLSSRSSAVRRMSGFWSGARDEVEVQRIDSDGSFSLRANRRLSGLQVTFLTVAAVFLALLSDYITSGEAVKAPTVLLFAVLLLALRAKSLHLIVTSLIFAGVAAYALRVRPVDVMIVRMITFITASILAVLLSKSLRISEEWMRVAIALIRRIPQPVILTNRLGSIVLVNSEAERLLKVKETSLLEENLSQWLRLSGSTNEIEMDISKWEDRPPTGSVDIDFFLTKPREPVSLAASIFMVGRGKKRLFGFSLAGQKPIL